MHRPRRDREPQGRDAHNRARIADLAARLIAEHGLADWSLAKRKAARQLMLPERTTLPGDDEIEIVWLPTYAPWLNPIEKLWRWLRQDLLKLHRQAAEWAGLRQQVRAFLEQFAAGSPRLLEYVGLRGMGQLAQMLHAA